MTNLTPVQWRVLTFIRYWERTQKYFPRYSDIQYACAMPSRKATADVLELLDRKGLVQRMSRRINGHTVWRARSHPSASGMVGVEVPVLEAARAEV